jgi:hypothetical protein
MPSDKFVAKYIRQLEKQLQQQRADLKTLRQDLEFYRGKVERLEVSLMQNAPAMQSYASRTEQKPRIGQELEQTPQRLPFRELQRRWGAMNESDQAKALEQGWNVEMEESHAGSS